MDNPETLLLGAIVDSESCLLSTLLDLESSGQPDATGSTMADAFPSQHTSAGSDLKLPYPARSCAVEGSTDSICSDSAYSSVNSGSEIDFPLAEEPTKSLHSENFLDESTVSFILDANETTFESRSSRDSFGSEQSTVPCPICGGPVAGKAYGVDTCHGCKSFFRRLIRSGKTPVCRTNENACDMKKGPQHRCRACRYQKCLAVGMDVSAVQAPRDAIGPRKRKEEADSQEPKKRRIADFSAIYFPQGDEALHGRIAASLHDVADHLNNLTTRVFFWAKDLPDFWKFTNADQSALVHNHRIPHLLLEIAARSKHCHPYLLMGERFFIDTRTSAPMQRMGDIISRCIMEPFRRIELDEMELVLMKSFIFFDSTLPWIADRGLLMERQKETFSKLEHEIRSRPGIYSQRFDQICSLIDSWNETTSDISNLLREAGLLQQIFI